MTLSASDRQRAFHDASLQWVLRESERASRRPLMIGLCAPQGAGKTTFVRALVRLLDAVGRRTVALSIDDFYLTHDEQLRVAEAHPGNRYLEHRGAPGTHDIGLGEVTLEGLRRLGQGDSMRLPAYDKTAFGGRGDRAPVSSWPEVRGPLDVVLLEGWCLAFRAVPGAALSDPALLPVNAALAEYGRWQRQLDALMSFRARSLEQIVAWRVEAEECSRAEGRPGLDRAAAEDYIRRFLPIYEAYQDTILGEGPWGDRRLAFTLDADRLPVS